MTQQNQIALIVAFYLSKFDREALTALGYKTFTAAFSDIGLRLGANKNTVKNMRDEYDPLHSNERLGWYQRPLTDKPSRVAVAQMFDDLEFVGFTSFVRELLSSDDYRNSEEVQQITGNFISDDQNNARVFTPRGPTGKKAENLFLELLGAGKLPISGQFTDRRDDGCGYDFDVHFGALHYKIEVKGLASADGGISLTEKEWDKSQQLNNYCLFLAYNLNSDPMWKWIDKLQFLEPQRKVTTVVQLSWYLSPSQVKTLINPSCALFE